MAYGWINGGAASLKSLMKIAVKIMELMPNGWHGKSKYQWIGNWVVWMKYLKPLMGGQKWWLQLCMVMLEHHFGIYMLNLSENMIFC